MKMNGTDKPVFSSNAIRLSGRQLVVAAGIVVALCALMPGAWKAVEGFSPGPDYRIPYSLGNDYWLYNRFCKDVSAEDKIFMIGDSVVWGHYVAKDETLSHYLSEQNKEAACVNLSIDGIHPVAMAGLIQHYARPLSGKKVVLLCNPLWMSSPRHDLQVKKEFSFNHPQLVPQFCPRIPCYRESYSKRIGIAVARSLPFFGWVQHLKIAYFDSHDMTSWAMKHPYEHHARAILARKGPDGSLELPSPDEMPVPSPVAKPWTEKKIRKADFQWVDIETSLQWDAFTRTIRILRSRGNKVFVVVGPYNEHMIKEESLSAYNTMKTKIEVWLKENNVPCFIPRALPSEMYADASHPLGCGYALLAEWMLEDAEFERWWK